jgi:hydroxymethylbilane synthase
MNSKRLIIGTRGSDLALWQANYIRNILASEHDCQAEIEIIKTKGDKVDDVGFDKIEGKGFFTKELEDALLAEDIDVAVHSLKDLMTTQPERLKLGAVGFRDDPRELLLIRKESYARGGYLPVMEGGVIGTSSARRQCQIAYHNRSVRIKDLRGNVVTRVKKLREGHCDAIIIAAAGPRRLGLDLSDLKAVYLAPEIFLPCPGQGILGIQIRENDSHVESIIKKLDSPHFRTAVQLERGLLAKFDSGCSLPLGVYSQVKHNSYRLTAVLGVKRDDLWRELIWSDIEGADLQEIVEQTHTILAREGVS